MYIKLIRNEPQGSAITGRLVINGRWFCNTLERVGYQIPALCYHLAVTMSPKFRRLLPIVQNVPQRSGIRFHVGKVPKHSTGCILLPDRETENHFTNLLLDIQAHEEIILEVTVTIGIVMPAYTEYSTVSTSIVLGESVLLGVVPENYTHVATNEELWDKVNNFLEV